MKPLIHNRIKKPRKVLILGSGALKIGEAGEFDYSGSQAIKALKQEGIKTVLINPNIATIQTSENLADRVYFLPVNAEFTERIIAKERPDGILLSFGGQTALNCGIALHRAGVLKRFKVKVLGTPVESIILTEDRQKFAQHLRKIGVPTPKSFIAFSVKEALKNARKIGYPVMMRAGFALGGLNSGAAFNQTELKFLAKKALTAGAPQILIEQYLRHFKEIEYEVVRDKYGNSATVCNMENFDPLGIHTGDSIVVAPSQTLDNFEYHTLRQASINIVKSLGIVGECNVQFALNPNSPQPPLLKRGGARSSSPLQKGRLGGVDYYVIEVNARLSRSSALASKATGYPLAHVAAKLALGYNLAEVPNQVTKVTQSFFEPALDYVAVKIPRWDLEKFHGAKEVIGSSMKSVGEVMAIGRAFEEALQKCVRMIDGRNQGVCDNRLLGSDNIEHLLAVPTPRRLFAIAEAIKQKFSLDKIYKLTGIDPWFLARIENIVKAESQLTDEKILNRAKLLALKRLGFADKRIGKLTGKKEIEIRQLRQKYNIRPCVFNIDTLAGEREAATNYLYLTYHGKHNDVKPLSKSGVLVLGGGPYHIGSSVEFDWSCVYTAESLRKFGKKSIIINCNPETVSTDYDMSARLYFEDLSFESVADIYEFEKADSVVVSVGGQRPNTIAKKLAGFGIRLLGTSAVDIDRAEDRNKFSRLCDRLNIKQPLWQSFSQIDEALKFAGRAGFPVLVRPSYVLSGSSMSACFTPQQLERFIAMAANVSEEYPVTISKYIMYAKEIEVDAVAQNGKLLTCLISEHVENAGVHSGDATIVYPAQRVFSSTEHQLKDIAAKLSRALRVTGPLNIQFLVKDNVPFVIELNLRASRTFPFLSKATGINLAEKLTDAFFGKGAPIAVEYPKYAAVKSPQFSFARLTGADPVLRVEMSSTGEVAAFGDTYEEALLKSVMATVSLPAGKSVLLSLGGDVNKKRFLDAANALWKAGYKIYATDSTAEFLRAAGIAAEVVSKISQNLKGKKSVLDAINAKAVAFVVNLSEYGSKAENRFLQRFSDGYYIRRAAVDNQLPLFTDLQLAKAFVKALTSLTRTDLKIKAWDEYMNS